MKIEGDLQKSWSTPEILSKIDCGERDFFHISYTIPSDALLEYRFIIDGKSIIDVKNPQVTQSFDYGDRSIFAMPGFVQSSVTKMRHGIDKDVTSRRVFKTDQAPFTDHLVWVYTPYGYWKDTKYAITWNFSLSLGISCSYSLMCPNKPPCRSTMGLPCPYISIVNPGVSYVQVVSGLRIIAVNYFRRLLGIGAETHTGKQNQNSGIK